MFLISLIRLVVCEDGFSLYFHSESIYTYGVFIIHLNLLLQHPVCAAEASWTETETQPFIPYIDLYSLEIRHVHTYVRAEIEVNYRNVCRSPVDKMTHEPQTCIEIRIVI